MTHKTYRDLQNHDLKIRKEKVTPLIEKIRELTLEEALKLQEVISQLMWLSLQTVEEKNIINKTNENDVEELV